jgi:DNA-binding FadR family transcriptional regulator
VPGRIEKSIEEHEKIVNCVLKENPEAVRKAMEEHWNYKREMLIKYLDELSLLSH